MFFLLFRAQPVLLLPPHDQNKQAHQSQYLSERKEVGKAGGGTRETCRLSDRELLPSTVSDGPILKCIRVLSLLPTPPSTALANWT